MKCENWEGREEEDTINHNNLQSIFFPFFCEEALQVSMPARKTAILGTNVTLQCKISDYPPPELDIKKTMFIWYLETSEGNKIEKLHSVVAGEHSSNRGGSRLDTIQLKNGNAALFLPQIQLNEEGKYICVVILTSVKAEGATILDLVGK